MTIETAEPVTLDHTLEGLYSREGNASKLVLFFAQPTSPTQFQSTKYPYQGPLFPRKNNRISTLRRLHNSPVKFALVAGNLPVILLDPNFQENEGSEPKGESSHFYTDALEVFGQLHPSQRVKLSIIRSCEDLVLEPNSKLVVLGPLDRLDHLPHVVDPEVHYELLSKRGLAKGGLPTPETSVIDTILNPNKIHHLDDLNEEICRMLTPISERGLPFVVKVPQAIGGVGTFLVQTETERKSAIERLRGELPQMLQDFNPQNQHLHPCCLITQNFVSGETVGISIFVTQKGKGVFISCWKQVMSERGTWAGGIICYTEQPKLERKYAAIIDQIALFLHNRGYYGPAGADVLTDGNGMHLIVDLNVRVTGSYSLGCLRGHFERRGLSFALLYSFTVHCNQSDFRKRFQKEMTDGSLVIQAWTSNLPDGSSMVSVNIAAPSQAELEMFLNKFKAFISLLDQDLRRRELAPWNFS